MDEDKYTRKQRVGLGFLFLLLLAVVVGLWILDARYWHMGIGATIVYGILGLGFGVASIMNFAVAVFWDKTGKPNWM